MNRNLLLEALIKYISGVLLVGLLIFLPAGSLAFAQGWLLMAALFIPMFFAGLVMFFKCPELLKKRLNAKEKRAQQDRVVKLSGLMFIAGFILSGLNFRFGWHVLPGWISIIAVVLLLAAYLMFAEVLRENAYLSRTIEVQQGQRVIDTGLYGIVRHPMYTATLILFLMMPLILGSLHAFAVFLVYPFLIAVRIRNEEALLEAELSGYDRYKTRVKYKMIPFVW